MYINNVITLARNIPPKNFFESPFPKFSLNYFIQKFLQIF